MDDKAADEGFYPRPRWYHGRGAQTGSAASVLRPAETGGVRKKAIRYQQPRGLRWRIYLPRGRAGLAGDHLADLA